ncbi:MAG: putative metal-dependent hydrolase [Acidobacteriota bacterium]|nr:putative metal-dependent hydrolase [Acidobacteriota bacterium]
MNEDLRYPIGNFDKSIEITPENRQQLIETIEELPEKIKSATNDLSDEQLDTPYRPSGWTVRQTVHHVADSHLNSFMRFKLALTEELPTIRPYFEDRWAELADSRMPIDVSIKIIEGIHARWTNLLQSMSEEAFNKQLNHPDSGVWTLEKMLALYGWHSRHHTAHINNLRIRNNW